MTTSSIDGGTASADARISSTRTKLELLHHGARLTRAAAALIAAHGKPPVRVRSGSCGGLDVVLPGDVGVNVPVREVFALASPLVFEADDEDDERLVVRDRRDASTVVAVPVPAPQFQTQTGPGSLARVGQVCFDRLGIGLTNRCTFWKGSDRRCKFCSIGLNRPDEDRDKDLTDIGDVIDVAFADPQWPARHVLLGGGTLEGPDAGGRRMAQIARRAKRAWPDRRIYAMITPPADLSVIAEMREAGIDELGINLELHDERLADEMLPGKHREIGRARYWTALEEVAAVFGPIDARSILIAGLEPVESTLAGVEELAARGVMPILSSFRPLDGTALAGHARPDPAAMWDLAVGAAEVAGRHGLPIGPTCLACQANCVTPPLHEAYRHY